MEEVGFESTHAAKLLTEAALGTLGERVTDGQAKALATELLDEFARTLTDLPVGEAEEFGYHGFLERVSDQADMSQDETLPGTRGVAATLAEVAGGEFADTRGQFPDEFDLLLGLGEPMETDEFPANVGRRAGMESAEDVLDVTAATVLHEPVAAGELRKFLTYLPDALDVPARPPDQPEAFPGEEFVRRLAERQGVDAPTAQRRARAVLATVAEAASDHEMKNVRSQLPNEYDVLFEPPDVGGTE